MEDGDALITESLGGQEDHVAVEIVRLIKYKAVVYLRKTKDGEHQYYSFVEHIHTQTAEKRNIRDIEHKQVQTTTVRNTGCLPVHDHLSQLSHSHRFGKLCCFLHIPQDCKISFIFGRVMCGGRAIAKQIALTDVWSQHLGRHLVEVKGPCKTTLAVEKNLAMVPL